MTIDYERLGEQYEESQVERGGGGGGKKKKLEHQGKKTAAARRDTLVDQSRENAQEQQEKYPEVSEEENIEIGATVRRLIGLDEKEDGLPRLTNYFQWLVKVLTDDEYREARGVEKESEVVLFRRSKGAGGQNVNKVSTAVRLTHVPTGLKLQRYEKRSQEANREDALKAASDMVNQHLVLWLEYVTEGSLSTLLMVRRRLEELSIDNLSGSKEDALERIKEVVLRERD